MDKELTLDLSGIIDEETFHEYVSKKLNFPGYYGCNLNAFWDCITSDEQSSMPCKLVVEGLDELKENLPTLHQIVIEQLFDYAEMFPNREIEFRLDTPAAKDIEFDAG